MGLVHATFSGSLNKEPKQESSVFLVHGSRWLKW